MQKRKGTWSDSKHVTAHYRWLEVKEVKSLTKTIQDLGNSFNCLCVLDTKHIKREAVVKPVITVQELGKKQFDDYVEKKLDQKTDPSL